MRLEAARLRARARGLEANQPARAEVVHTNADQWDQTADHVESMDQVVARLGDVVLKLTRLGELLK
jgi:hypothetical protein